ncbi:MAG: hypothetical protein JRF33_19900 [Deltaproteobacteria bacterium]|nr:hypothetical protein [Deltaproteobacteria bacterium]
MTRRARKLLPEGSRIVFHTHDTAGLSIAAYLAAIEAGVDQVDLSLAPVSHGTAQPGVITMWQALKGTDYKLDVDLRKVIEAEAVFKDSMKDYFFPPEAQAVEPLIPLSPMPGGALTANTQMMRDNQIMDRYPDVLEAMGEVVERGGLGTSVTPVSQFYFQQAFNNVMLGPWKRIADGYGKMVLGYFGKTPVPPDPEVVRLASEQLKLPPTTRSPMELAEEDPEKGLEAAARRLDEAGLLKTEENIFIAATCKEKGLTFLKGEAKVAVRKKGVDDPNGKQTEHKPVSAPPPQPQPAGQQAVEAPRPSPPATRRRRRTYHIPEEHQGTPIVAGMPGRIVRICVDEGDLVMQGQSIMVLESMLLEQEVQAPKDGTVTELLVHQGDYVGFQHLLALID